MRQVVLDTETTGLEVELQHRVIEIGCVELVNRRLTGRHFHRYLDPERDIDAGAHAVHGLTRERLSTEPKFAQVQAELLEFLRDAELIIHNAPFDVAFLNAEFQRVAAAAAAGGATGPGSASAAGGGGGSGGATVPGSASAACGEGGSGGATLQGSASAAGGEGGSGGATVPGGVTEEGGGGGSGGAIVPGGVTEEGAAAVTGGADAPGMATGAGGAATPVPLAPPLQITEVCRVLDTLALARQMHPGQRNNLDALCKRYAVDNSHREYHGALLDARILAEVYLAMTGGQAKLTLSEESDTARSRARQAKPQRLSQGARIVVIRASAEELAAHEHALALLDAASRGNTVWRRL